jgi:O-acetyl-ADP-ribose deacetylase (regulator of RNase III)
MKIRYVVGDATLPTGPGPKIIAHVCNDIGKWGKGFVVALSRRWPQPEAAFRRAYAGTRKPALGDVDFVPVGDDVIVANMIGQHGVARRGASGPPPVRYDAILSALEKVGEHAKKIGATVHMPRIAAGLAGGSWEEIEPLIEKALSARGVQAHVYDLP